MIILYTIFFVFVTIGQGAEDEKTPFTLEESLFKYNEKYLIDPEWISDKEFLYANATTNDTIIYNAETNEKTILFQYSLIKDKFSDFDDYEISPDDKYVLITRDVRPAPGRSIEAKYSIYSIEEKWFVNLHNDSHLQLAIWGTKGNNLAYIYLNNIYYIPTVSIQHFDDSTVQITDSGIPHVVFNGIADVVNSVEHPPPTETIFFSPDSNRLMYVEFNDKNVEEMPHMDYGTNEKQIPQYPKTIKTRVPKAGRTNPTAKINYVDLSEPENIVTGTTLVTTVWKINEHHLFDDFGWVNNNEMVFSICNRVQNETQIITCNVPSKSNGFEQKCTIVYEEKITDGWSDVALPVFSKNGSMFINIVQQMTANHSSKFDHLTLFYKRKGAWSVPLTHGPFDDIEIIAWDEEHDLIYYTAVDENSASRTHVYAVNTVNPEPKCLTCNLVLPDNSPCHSFSTDADFSTNFTYVAISCSGPSPTMTIIYKNPIGEMVAVLEDNSELKSKLEKKLLPKVVDYRVKISDEFEADARLFFPPSMDKDKKYPLIIDMYNAPGYRQIIDDFSIDYLHYLTTNLSIIYGLIDGRGSSRRGRDLMYATYRKLGTGEVEDEIQVTKYLQENVPNVDPKRTGIWGWSFGGYAAAKTLENDVNDVFKCGISIAPVTDWLLQDTYYTEAYMGLPTKEDNLDNYIKADLLSNVTNLMNKKFYLIHGTSDDQVDYQHTMLFSKKLTDSGILFQQQSYADENHDLGGVISHVYRSMTEFWKDCFHLHD